MTRTPLRPLLLLSFTFLLAATLPAQQKSPLSKFRIIPGPKPGGGVVKITVGGNNAVEAEREDYAILQGDVRIEYQDIKMRADKVTFNNKTKDADAEGNVVIDQGPTRITASHAIYNLDTKTGTFFNAVGTLDPTMYFSGDQIEKLDEDTFTVTNGMFTSCDLDRPAWSFRIRQARVVRDNYAHMKDVSFRTRIAPLFWTPRLIWPTKADRSQGFLIPRLVLAGQFGPRLEMAYFVPFGPSADATVNTDLSAQGYTGAGMEIRYVPSENVKVGDLNAYVVRDPHPELYSSNPTAVGPVYHWRYRYQHAQDNLPGGFRGVVDVEDFSDLDFFRQYDRDPRVHTLSNIYSSAYLTKNTSRFSLNFLADRRQILLFSQDQKFEQLPSLQFRMYPQKLGPTPFYFSMESSASHLQMSAFLRNFSTGVLERTSSTNYFRTDVFPTLSLQMLTPPWLSIRPQISVRDTYYSASIVPGDNPASPSTPLSNAVNRFYTQGQVDVVGPSFSRVFNTQIGGFARLKHVIEPRVTYVYTSDVTNQNEIIRFDTVDTPLLPTVRDSVQYSLTQRLIGKERSKDSPTGGSAREIMSFSLTQSISLSKPFTNGTGGTLPGFTTTQCTDCKFTPLVATLHVNPYQAVTVDANATFGNVSHQIDQTSLSANLIGTGAASDKYLGLTWFAAFHNPLQTPTGTIESTASSQWRVNVGSYLVPNRLKADLLLNYDAQQHQFLEQRYVLGYTGSCYGIALAPRRYLTYTVQGIKNKWAFDFAISLKNVGSVGNVR